MPIEQIEVIAQSITMPCSCYNTGAYGHICGITTYLPCCEVGGGNG